jgi:hypothetical protein
MKKSTEFEVLSEHGKGILKQIYLTELGYVMVRIYFPESRKTINFNLQLISNLLSNSKITLADSKCLTSYEASS